MTDETTETEITIKVTGLTLVTSATPNKSGDTIVGYVDCFVEWLSIRGAALVKLSTGGYTLWEPLGKDDRLPRRSMQLKRHVRRAVADAALPVYRSLGGEL